MASTTEPKAANQPAAAEEWNWAYGGSPSQIAGDTVYWVVRSDPAKQMVIRDYSGYDQIVSGDTAADLIMDLRPGGKVEPTISAEDYSRFVIGDGSVIESAGGGSGNDYIIGNSSNNGLSGGGGRDTLIGGAGNDTILGGHYGDSLNPYSADVAVFSGPKALYDVKRTGDDTFVVSGPDGIDTLQGIAYLKFSDSPSPIRPYQMPEKGGFDAARYLAGNPDLLMAYGYDPNAAVNHYMNWGWQERRSYTSFDPARYLASNPDLIQAFGSDTDAANLHYAKYGFLEGRSTIGFDAAGYLASNFDLLPLYRGDLSAAALHYVRWGYAAGLEPTFDAAAYMAANPDVAAAVKGDQTLAVQHYVTNGWAEGRKTRTGATLPNVIENTDVPLTYHVSGQISMGMTATGVLSSNLDTDVYLISLRKGDKLNLASFYAGTGTVTVSGPTLMLYNSKGSQVVYGTTNTLSYTAEAAGDYLIRLNSRTVETMNYRLIAAGTPVTGSSAAEGSAAMVAAPEALSQDGTGLQPAATGPDFTLPADPEPAFALTAQPSPDSRHSLSGMTGGTAGAHFDSFQGWDTAAGTIDDLLVAATRTTPFLGAPV